MSELLRERPSIVEIVGQTVSLRKAGKEYVGLCPFHSEKTPSFTVNEDKGFFYCFGCGTGGDVIRFIEKIEGLNFTEALNRLGLADRLIPKPKRDVIEKKQFVREASKSLTTWALELSDRVGARLRDLGQRAHTARKVMAELGETANGELLKDKIEIIFREWLILSDLQNDLTNPENILELWREREAIGSIVGDEEAYSLQEIEGGFPPLTDTYRERVWAYLRGEA